MSRSRRPRLTAEQISTMSERDFGKITSDDIYELAVIVRKFIKEFDTDVTKDRNIAKSFAYASA